MTYPQEQERTLISSITKNLERVVFKLFNIQSLQPFLGDPCWTPFDSRLYELVDRLRASGLNRTPEAEFQFMFVELTRRCTTGALSRHSRRKVA